MTKNINIKFGFFLILAGCLLSSCGKNSDIPIVKLAENNANMAIGVNFESQKVVVLDTKTGNEVKGCEPRLYIETKQSGLENTQKTNDQLCNVKIVDTDPNSQLNLALKSSLKPIFGNIEKNGKIIPAKFVVTVIASYEGSNCQTIYVGGQYITICTNPRGR